MTDDQAARLYDRLLAAYVQVSPPEETRDLYVRYFRDLDAKAAEFVLEELIADSTAMPTIAEIRRRVLERNYPVPTALEAWKSITARGQEIHPLAKELCDLFGGMWTIRNADQPTVSGRSS